MFPFFAVHPKSLADLQDAIAAGSVSQIRIVGALPPDAVGLARVDVRWEQGGIAHATKIVQLSDSSVTQPGQRSADEEEVGDVRDDLRGLPGGESGHRGYHRYHQVKWGLGPAFLALGGRPPWRAREPSGRLFTGG